MFERDPLACPACEQAMTPLALCRSPGKVIASSSGKLIAASPGNVITASSAKVIAPARPR